MNNFLTILFFTSPLILAAVIYYFKFEQAVSIIDSLNIWVIKTREKYLGQPGYFKKLVIRPCLWSLSFVMTQTDDIEDNYARVAVRTAAYLYLFGFFLLVAYFAVAIFVALVLLVIASWIFTMFTESGKTTSYVTRSAGERVRNKKFYNTEGMFDKQTHRVDDEGNIYDTRGVFDKKVGQVTEDGKILDTTGVFARQTAAIDGDGGIYDTTGVFDKKVGEIDGDGTVKDTTGVFSKQKGKLK